MKYNLFWKDIIIGILEIDDKGQYLFLRNEENMEKASFDGMPKTLLPDSTDGFVLPEKLPFFYERISRSKNEEEIGYFTDFFVLRKI